MTEKLAGILGGMGPEATVDLMQRIIQLTPVSGKALWDYCPQCTGYGRNRPWPVSTV